MKTDLIDALDAIEKERRINKEVLIEAIESSLISAYKRNFGSTANVRVNLDRETGEIRVFTAKQVVETVEDPAGQMSLEEARAINEYHESGDVIEQEITPQSFGRIAAQIAKQVVMQRIREAERGVIFEEYIEKEDEVLTAVVQRVEKNNVYVELGRTEGLLSASDMIPGEKYNVNDRLKVYVLEVKRTNKGPQVIVSRTHPGLVKRLFEFEVPEIQDGIVQIKSIAREAGFRTKIAVYSTDEQVDPVGACVGQRGTRVENIVQELSGEKIDIIKWSQDPGEFIANALGPARVIMVQINEAEKSSKVVVPDNQLSLAIGKEGQNARLAAKLTAWKIDIKSQTQSQQALFASMGDPTDDEDDEFDSFDELDIEEQADDTPGEDIE
jgi:N utilization substance protein A